MQSKLLGKIKADFSKFEDKALAILIYGSRANGKATIKSDIDICLIAGSKENAKQLYQETLSLQAKDPSYDIHIFELLPLYLKHEIIANHKIISCKNPIELSYYFYFFRKLWQDQAVNRIKG